MVIGVEEPILIKGIGEIVAKVDSGNSGYNVIHGEDLVVQGDIITFKTLNKDGIERRVSKKIKDTININIGGGHIQQRPVVELDVQFGGDDYKKVQFSITNRGDNEHKVLISKDFVGKELDALIDVTKDNISNDNINVDYVTEASIGKAVDTFVTGSKAQKTALSDMTARRKAMWGEETEPIASGQMNPELKDEVDSISNLAQQIKDDAKLIKQQLGKQEDKLNSPSENNPNGLNVSAAPDNISVYKVLDYTGGTYSNQQKPDKNFQDRVKKALKKYKDFKNESNAGRVKREEKEGLKNTTLKEAAETSIQTTQNSISQQNLAAPVKSAAQQSQSENNTDNIVDPTTQIQGVEGEKDISKMTEKEVEEVLQELKNRNRAIFYIIGFITDFHGNKLLQGEDLFNALGTKVIDSWNIKICQGKDWSANAFKPFAKQVAESVKEGAKGLFALCTGPANARNVEFFTNPGIYGGVTDKKNANNQEISPELIEEYNQLNIEYINLGGEGQISEEAINTMLENYNVKPSNPGEITQEIIDEFNQLNREYIAIAEDMHTQPEDYIKPEDLQTLIELVMEFAKDKRQNEIPADSENEPSTYNHGK